MQVIKTAQKLIYNDETKFRKAETKQAPESSNEDLSS